MTKIYTTASAFLILLAAFAATFSVALITAEVEPAYAQSSTNSRGTPGGGGGQTGGGGGDFTSNDGGLIPGRMPCGIGATSIHCPPQRRPKVEIAETRPEECSCDRVYREISGRLLIVTECHSAHDVDVSLPVDLCKPQKNIY
ncbi:MAG: hypothetical protein ACTSSQ_00845 [Alphaproteobacteria bacterium]